MKKVLFWTVQCTWGILQTLVGLILLLCVSNSITDYKSFKCAHTIIATESRLPGAISLGSFITCFFEPTETLLMHEYGHCIQSLILGPLYLFVIALPSIIWCGCFEKYRRTHNISYYSFYTEKWANKLGGVRV